MTALAATLVHFLWQGAIVAFLLAAANLVLTRAVSRYAAACAALAAMLGWSAATYIVLVRRAPPAQETAVLTRSGRTAATPAPASLAGSLDTALPELPVSTGRAVVLFWLAGVAVLSTRLAGGWAAAARLSRRGVEEPSQIWIGRVESLASRLGSTRPVRLLASALIEAPAALGVVWPVILVPVGAFTALSIQELEAILAHELAHVRRRDVLANLLQSAAETLLFYHPAVWWVSHRIRVERENACDDLAVEACGDAAVYARALVNLEEARAAALPRLAAASTGGSLLQRVRRLVTPRAARPDRLPPSIAAVLALVAVSLLGAAARMTPSPEAPGASWPMAPESAVATPLQTAPPATQPAIPPPPTPPPPAAAGARAARPTTPAPAVSPVTAPKEVSGALPRFSPSQLIAFRIHGVSPEFVEELRALGYSRVSADDLVAMRIHGVTPDYIRAMNRRSGDRLSIHKLIEARLFGIRGDER